MMVPRKIPLILLVLTAFSISSMAQQTKTQCSNPSDPTGWVTIHIVTDFSSACPLIQNNFKTIEEIDTLGPQAILSACNDGASLPDGWVVSGFGTSASDCGGFSGNVKTLFNTNGMPLGSQLVVCFPSSPIPTGWTTLGTGTTGQYSQTSPDVRTIRRDTGPDLSVGVSPSSQAIVQGGTASYQVAINRVGGLAGAVLLSASGVPAGGNVTFSPNNTTGNSSTMTVSTSTGSSVGTSGMTVSAVSRAYTRTTTATLTIQQPGDFSLSVLPGKKTLLQGTTTSVQIAINRSGGFSPAVTLSIAPLPSGVAVGFSPNDTGAGSSILTITATKTASVGAHPPTITGTSGSLVRTVPPTLTVSSLPSWWEAVRQLLQ